MTTDPNQEKRNARRASRTQFDDDNFTVIKANEQPPEAEKEQSGFGDRMNASGYKITKAKPKPSVPEGWREKP